MTLYYDDNRGTDRFTLQDFEPSFGMKMDNAVREAWLESYGPVLTDRLELSRRGNQGPKLPAAEAAERIKASGLRLDLTPKDGQYTEAQLEFLLERQRELTMIRDVRDRTPWDLGSPVRGVAMFGAGILDPINLATAFVPWSRAIPAAQGLRAASLSASAATRTAGRAGFGAIDGGISTAVLEPFYFGMRQSLGDDYDAYDSMLNIGFGAAFGGGVIAGGGAGVDLFRRAMGREQPFDAYRGLSVEQIQQVQGLRAEIANGMDLRDAQRVLDTYTPEMRRAAGFPDPEAPPVAPADPAPAAPAARAADVTAMMDPELRPPSRTADEMDVPQTTRRNDLAVFLRDTGGLAPSLARDAGGDTAVQMNRQLAGIVNRNGAENYDQLTERLIEDGFLPAGMDSGSIEAADMAADLVARALNGERILRIEGQLAEMELRQREEFDAADRARFESDLEARLEREAIQGEGRAVSEPEPMIDRIPFFEPETREAALRAGVAQAAEGRMIDVDAILNTDEAVGATAGMEQIADAAQRNRQPEAVRVADFEASAAVDERLAAAPKWDGLADAEAALADADALLADTVKAGDQAFKYARAQGGPVTETPEFKAWFGDSKVVNPDGTPMVVYHGTGNLEGFTAFDPSLTGKGNDQIGSGFYFTTKPEEASGYTTAVTQNAGPGAAKLGGDSSPGVLPVYLSIKNPLVIQGSSLRDVDIDITPKQALAIIKRAPSILDLDESPIGNWIDVWSAGKITDKMIAEVAQNYTGASLLSLEGDFFRGDATAFRTALRDFLGYDGVVQDFGGGHKHFVAWFPEQVKSAIGNRGTFDPANPDILYSRGLTGQSAADALTASIRNAFGDDSAALMDAGRVQIVATPADIPGGPHPGDVKAATAPDGTVYVVAENVSELEARGILLHEVGVHVGMERMLGSDVFGSVLTELDDAIARGESWAQAARAAVPADTLPMHVREEQLAYLVQNAPELPIVQRILAAVRAWAYRTFQFARERMTLTEGDFRAMAVSALHHAAREGRAGQGAMVPAFSRDVPQTETKAFRDWFGGSKVVDENGKPLVVYHYTNNSFTTFDISKAEDHGAAFWFTGRKFGEGEFAGRSKEMTVYLDIKKPFYTKDQYLVEEGPADPDFMKKMRKGGYDGIIYADPKNPTTSDGGSDMSQFVVFRPEQIKSATGNRGTFDPTNPDIRYSRGETPDPSTVDQVLKQYDDAVERAKQYSGVLRAAADKLDNDAQAIAAMRQALPSITENEIADLLSQLRKQVQGLRGAVQRARSTFAAEDTAGILQSDAMKAADMLANNLQMAAVIEKRNAALNVNARLKATSFVNQFRDKGLDFEGFAALLVGSERVRTGSRVSIDAEYKGFRGEWVGGMIADVEKRGLMRDFISGVFDRDIYDALWRMGTESPDLAGLPPQAVQLAEIINKYQTDARNTRNRFGAWIRDLQGYITRQSHDMYKIREVTDAEWIDFVKDKIDIAKMTQLGLISETDPISSLRGLYDDFAAGVHMKAVVAEDDLGAFGRGSNLARRESVSRAIYFKDGLAAYEYNERFGYGRLAESVLHGLDHAARSASLMKTLGTNPEATFTRLLDEYEATLAPDPARRSKFREKRQALMNMMAEVDGSINVPGNVTGAKIGAFLRAWQTMAKLGGALISSFSDLAGYGAELRYAQGKNLLSGVGDGIAKLVQGRASDERLAITTSLGVFHESMMGAVTARFDSPDLVHGKMAAAMQMFFRLNGLAWWTETLRDGAALTHSHYMATQASKPLDAIDPEFRRMLQLYNIDAGKWDLLRMSQMQMADGRAYMTPEGLRTVPRSAYEAYITSVGRTANDATVQNLMDDLAQALRVMAVDRAHHAVLEPNARTRAWMRRGTKPGTVPGELLRFIGQFKSFSIAVVQSVLGREVYGRGYDTLGEYLRKGHGDMLGLAYMVGLYGVLGYGAMAAKDMLRGREPRDPTDYRTVLAALAQGGGLGLYGDFLFGEYSRMGRTFTASLAGPVLGNLDIATDLWTRLRNGDDLAAASFNALLQNTPFANLFWLRPVLNYLILYHIQEALNPGFLRRMEKRIERENGQTFLLPPSQVVR